MTASDPWAQIAESPFVSLGTFRKSGEVVATPVWIARDGDELVVTTERNTGKVKRLRSNPAVTMRPCSRMGKVEPDAIEVTGVGRLSDDLAPANAVLGRKYKLQYRLILGFERLVRRIQRKPGERVIIRIAREP